MVEPDDEQVAEWIGRISQALLADAESLSAVVTTAITERIPPVAAEAATAQELVVSTRANIMRFLRAAAGPGGELVPAALAAPPEALDVARLFVRRGIDLELLANTYRWGQNAALQEWLRRAAELAPPELLPAILGRAAPLLFGYVDTVLAELREQMEQERADLQTGTAARREQTVRLLLDGAPVETHRAGRLLGYDLGGRHLAFVAWADPGVDLPHGDLERVATAVARLAGPGAALQIAPGRTSLWGWLRSSEPIDPSAVFAACAEAAALPRLALGAPHDGVEGFRRSHEEALAAQALVADRGAPGRRFVAFRDVELVTLLGGDRDRLRAFVLETLGPLAGGERAAQVLAETVRVHLREGGSVARTAALLGTHRNTVLGRLARAEEQLGHPLRDRWLAVAVALEADAQLGLTAGRGS